MPENENSHVARTLRTLEMLGNGPSTAVALAQELGVHERTASRLLESLVALGYVVECSSRGKPEYAVTLKIASLVWRVIERTDLVQVARPYVDRLCEALNETTHLCIPGEDTVVNLVHGPGEHLVTVKGIVGSQAPYHCTAIGRALLAHLPEQRRKLKGRTLKRYTQHTITDAADLWAELDVVRSREYAVDNLEFSGELRCVAAPVFDHTGRAVGALGMSAPSARFSECEVETVAGMVMSEARALSSELGFGGGTDVSGAASRDGRASAAH